MPLPKSKNTVGLGHAIMNKKAKDARRPRESTNYTTDLESTSRLKSVTQERDLEEFLSTAQLAGTEFTAEKQNIKVIQSPGIGASSAHNPFLLSTQEEKEALRKHSQLRTRLRVPRRPPWTKGMTVPELERQERDAFLEWRRNLAELQEKEDLIFTPFERNLEVWRQLWRVLERSHLVIQIVDARNPLRFRCEDLESYVQDVEGAEGEKGTGKGKRKSLLLINKADLLTLDQRRSWADYFDSQDIKYAFFSAANARALQEARKAKEEAEMDGEPETTRDSSDEEESDDDEGAEGLRESRAEASETSSEEEEDDEQGDGIHLGDIEEDENDPRTRVLSVLQLEDLFVKSAPDLSLFAQGDTPPPKLVVGLVGYPNVGKSSTINSLLGEKKVSVSSTPGKTKHFQTIHLSPSIVLCDCPGLVFPQFANTKADLVCDGVLPIDQLREHTAPVSLVAQRIPRDILEATYGLNIRTRGAEEGGDGQVTAEDLLIAFAIARGFMRSSQGNPDEARAARFVLKDYVNAKLLYAHAPPDIEKDVYMAISRDRAKERLRLAGKKLAPTTRVAKGADTFVAPQPISASSLAAAPKSNKVRNLDNDFFENSSSLAARPMFQGTARNGQELSRVQLYPHQNMMADDGIVSTNGGREIDGGKSKKHHKGNKRVKQRSGKGYD